jgi:16S rRNA (guanine(966)-N(2))-methyltransferase RsmD
VLDLFAGTGALGFEALSRGAARAVFVDQGGEAVRIISSNAQRLGVLDQVEVHRGVVAREVKRLAGRKVCFDLLFLDPPYGKGHIEITLPLLNDLACPHALLIAEHPVKEPPPQSCVEWHHIETRTYGDTAVSFYSKVTGDSPV